MAAHSRPIPRLAALGLAVACSTAVTSPVVAQAAPQSPSAGSQAAVVSVRVIGFNDLHGNLEPPMGRSGEVTLANGTTVEAGGAAYLAAHVRKLKGGAPHSLVVSSGDNIGASPLASALFHDEPTIEVLNAIGVKASAVGNHEFDEGYQELQRIQAGGCNKTDGCQFRSTYKGARFPYLGANVRFDNGKPALLPSTVQVRGGVPIGIIGVTLKNLPDVVLPSGVAGLKFTDEVAAINRTSKALQRRGVKAQVVVMHQGDETTGKGGPGACSLTTTTPARTIATRATSRVDAFFAAHTHQAEDCTVTDPAGHPRPLIQGLSFGRLLSVVDLKISTRTGDVLRSRTRAFNRIVTRKVTPDAKVAGIVARAVKLSAPIANRPVGSITQDLLGRGSSAPEKPLGDVIADAQLAATQANGAQIAITNPGGLRGDLTYASSPVGEGAGVVTYGEAFTVQPFANILQTITLTGAQLKAVLEQQQKEAGGETTWLQVSSGLHYTWSTGAAPGAHVSNLAVLGQPVNPATSYRVTVNNFLSGGGDGFSVFAQGTNLTGGAIDLDAFVAYLTAHPGLSAPTSDRITVVP